MFRKWQRLWRKFSKQLKRGLLIYHLELIELLDRYGMKQSRKSMKTKVSNLNNKISEKNLGKREINK
jgi:hypothetical protein